jgi:predicted nucleic acid-binding protein
VVSDTSPIRALHHLGLTSLLQRFYGEVLIPPAVAEELRDPAAALSPLDWSSIPGVRLQAPGDSTRVQHLLQTLDRGESEAIALALEVQATALLIDEREGRAVAASLGLMPVGVLGMLIQAKQEGLVPTVRPLINELRSGISFRISPALFAEITRLAGE